MNVKCSSYVCKCILSVFFIVIGISVFKVFSVTVVAVLALGTLADNQNVTKFWLETHSGFWF